MSVLEILWGVGGGEREREESVGSVDAGTRGREEEVGGGGVGGGGGEGH